MTEDIVRSCLPCPATTKQKLKESLKMTELPERPWQKLSLDFSAPYPSGQYCLIVAYDYSRYPVVEIVSTTSAAAVIPRLDNIFSMFGIPEKFKSDDSPPFQSREFAEYARTQGFRHRKFTPFHPEANGEAERFVKTLEKFITTTTVEGNSWRMSLPDFLRVYRSTPHTLTQSEVHILNSLVEEKCVLKFLSSLSTEKKTLRCDRKTLRQREKMKKYADKRANAKYPSSKKVIWWCCVKKRKTSSVHHMRASLTLFQYHNFHCHSSQPSKSELTGNRFPSMKES